MNVLFLTLVDINTIYSSGIYADLVREFDKHNHKIYVISPVEKRTGNKTHLLYESNTVILKLRIGNTQKTNIIEKGISTVLIEPSFKKAVKKYFSNVKFDLVLYSTPPITWVSTIEYIKKRDGAKTYLLLKDIFPQNAVDLGMMSTTGVNGLLYRHFRKQEKKLYHISDHIGCMSPANVQYIIEHNPEVDSSVIEVCPNAIEVVDKSVDTATREQIRIKYGIPLDKKVFVYGGNLGKPQGVPFLMECLKKCENIENIFFLIVGDGTEYHLIHDYVEKKKTLNVKLMKRLPKEDYDTMVGACDLGLIFLDHRFTIPNFPSRLLSYMAARLPVLAVTDISSDIGKTVIDGRFGWWCESDDAEIFCTLAQKISLMRNDEFRLKGNRAFEYMINNFNVNDIYCRIIAD